LVRELFKEDIEICANIFIDAYSKEPWNENHDFEKVKVFLNKFTSGNTYIGWVILKKGQIAGFSRGYNSIHREGLFQNRRYLHSTRYAKERNRRRTN